LYLKICASAKPEMKPAQNPFISSIGVNSSISSKLKQEKKKKTYEQVVNSRSCWDVKIHFIVEKLKNKEQSAINKGEN
jgi:hypothetical protein